jgi:hypothetical protein
MRALFDRILGPRGTLFRQAVGATAQDEEGCERKSLRLPTHIEGSCSEDLFESSPVFWHFCCVKQIHTNLQVFDHACCW